MEDESRRKREAEAEMEMMNNRVTMDDSQSESEVEGASGGSKSTPKRKRGRKNVMSIQLSAALDRTKLSSRKATFVLIEAATSLGLDASQYNINYTSIHRQRRENRAMLATKVKEQF